MLRSLGWTNHAARLTRDNNATDSTPGYIISACYNTACLASLAASARRNVFRNKADEGRRPGFKEDATDGACAIICLAGTEWLRELREERASARSSVSSLDARGRNVLRDSCDPLARYSLGFGLDVLGARPGAHANHASVACGFTGSLRQLCSCQTPPAGDSGCNHEGIAGQHGYHRRYSEEANRLRQVDTGCTGRTHGLSARSGGTDRHGRGGRDGMGRRLGGTRLVLDCKCMQMKESDCTHSRTERECVLAVHCAYASKESGIADRGSE